jgi:bifunctional ADP-heptose synthase (sugar kinase/adenylyltransferase)
MDGAGVGLESCLALIESVSKFKVLFVGHQIIDEYHYVSSLGKSPKEHLISVRFNDKEVFDGGVVAAANHARNFCGAVHVRLVGPGVRKVRYVDPTYTRKLFEVHFDGKTEMPTPHYDSDYDAVVVTDFGHGKIPPISGDFIAVNAQTNSANIGFNLITKYASADYIVIDEPEARLAAADRDGPIEDVILKLAIGRCNKFVVTHGSKGAIGYDGGFHRMHAYTDRVIDTMGAGDAFFAVTAPMAKHGSMKDIIAIGNAAGAIKTQIVGHRESVTKEKLVSFLKERSAQ